MNDEITFERIIEGKERVKCFCPSCGETDHVKVNGGDNKPWMLCLECREALALGHWRNREVSEFID